MNIESEINKELFVPQNERLLVALEVQRRQKKRRSFLPTSSREDYTTFICVSGKNFLTHGSRSNPKAARMNELLFLVNLVVSQMILVWSRFFK